LIDVCGAIFWIGGTKSKRDATVAENCNRSPIARVNGLVGATDTAKRTKQALQHTHWPIYTLQVLAALGSLRRCPRRRGDSRLTMQTTVEGSSKQHCTP
jgi:hypothetical protein